MYALEIQNLRRVIQTSISLLRHKMEEVVAGATLSQASEGRLLSL